MRSSSILVLILACGSAACPDPGPPSPRYITRVAVSQVVQAQSPTVTAQISIPGMDQRRVRDVRMAIRSTREPDRPFVPVADELTSVAGGTTWRGELPPLNVGPYEVRLSARYMPFDPPNLPVGEDLVDVTTQAFSVGVDEVECFDFASGLQGWTFDGYHADGQTLAPSCDVALLHVPQYGVIVVATGDCAPTGTGSSAPITFDLVSPGVSARPGWSNAEGAMARVDGAAELTTSAHLLLTGGGEAVGAAVEGTEPAGMVNEFHRVELPAEAVVDRLRLRVSIPPGEQVLGPDASYRVDAVCPLPPRPW